MKQLVMKPIRYSRRQVALMVTFATIYSSGFATQVGEASTLIPKIAAGEAPPTPAVLRHFGLEADGQGYVWSPQ